MFRCTRVLHNLYGNKDVLEESARKFGICELDDWYKVSTKNLQEDPVLDNLLNKNYNGSLWNALQESYPEHKWIPWKFSTRQYMKSFWNKKENQLIYFNWLGKELGFKMLEDWYKLQLKDLVDNGGSFFVEKHRNSLPKIMQSIYPDVEWLPWKFDRFSKGFWNDPQSQRSFFDWLGRKLGYKDINDWCNLNLDLIQKNGGAVLMQRIFNNSVEEVRP
jgi:hypothetical protein